MPIPSWPRLFLPQHSTEPSSINAQVCSHPAVIAIALDIPEKPDEETGLTGVVVVPSPSCP